MKKINSYFNGYFKYETDDSCLGNPTWNHLSLFLSWNLSVEEPCFEVDAIST